MPSLPDDEEVSLASSAGTPATPSACTIADEADDRRRHHRQPQAPHRLLACRDDRTDDDVLRQQLPQHDGVEEIVTSVIGRCRTSIIASGTTELVTPSAIRATSTLPTRGHRMLAGAQSRQPAQADGHAEQDHERLVRPQQRDNGAAALMPTTSGVRKISRYAATGGLAMTHPTRPSADHREHRVLDLDAGQRPDRQMPSSRTASSCRRRRTGLPLVRRWPSARPADGPARRGQCHAAGPGSSGGSAAAAASAAAPLRSAIASAGCPAPPGRRSRCRLRRRLTRSIMATRPGAPVRWLARKFARRPGRHGP